MGYYIDLTSIGIEEYKATLRTSHLIPIWKVLENDIEKNPDIINKYGIADLLRF